MSDQEYDDLDDLLDEDPSKLEGVHETTSKKEGQGSDLDGMKVMMNDLEDEFSNLMSTNKNENNEEIAANFKELMGMIGKNGEIDKEASNSTEFKNIVANTLDKIKENGPKVDTSINEEKKQANNSDDMVSQLLSQMGDLGGDNNIDDTILNLLGQMSSKEVLYQPMKDMTVEYMKWFDGNEAAGGSSVNEVDLKRYENQYETVKTIVGIYESPGYDNEKHKQEITNLLDTLEQLGESPVDNSINTAGVPDFNDLLDVDGGDANFENLEKELQDTCQQQ